MSFGLTSTGRDSCRLLNARSCLVSAAARFVLDLLGRLAASGSVADLVEHELRVRADHHEEIVEVVRDAAGEAPHDLELLRVLQLLFEGRALRDVARVEDDALHRSVVEQVARERFHRARRAVRVHHAAAERLGGERLGGDAVEHVARLLAILSGDEIDERAIEPVLRKKSEHSLDGGAHVGHVEPMVEHEHDIARVLHERPEARVANPALRHQLRRVERRHPLAREREDGHQKRAGAELQLERLNVLLRGEKEHAEGERDREERDLSHPCGRDLHAAVGRRRSLELRRCGQREEEHAADPAHVDHGASAVHHLFDREIAVPEVCDRRHQVRESDQAEDGAIAIVH
jgi:hypothetical protein